MGSSRRDRENAPGIKQRSRRKAYVPPSLQVQEIPLRGRTRRRTPRLSRFFDNQIGERSANRVGGLFAALKDRQAHRGLHGVLHAAGQAQKS
jgi:hypothetical protein